MSDPIQDNEPDSIPADEATQEENVAEVELTAEEKAAAEKAAAAEAKEYGRVSLRCDLLDRAIDLVFLSIAAFVLANPIDQWLQGFSFLSADHSILRLICLFGIFYAMHMAASVGLSYYSGFVVEHRYGLSRQSLGKWIRNYFIKNIIGIIFGLLLYVCLFWLIWTTQSWWWLAAAGVFFVVSVILGQLTPVLIMPLFYKVTPLEDEELLDRMKKLVDGTGLNIEGVYTLGLSSETSKANAMLAGLGNTRRVLLGDTLLAEFTPEELDVIFAHEIGHHVHKHIPKLMAIGVVSSLCGFWVCDQLLLHWADTASHSAIPIASLPFLMLVLNVMTMLFEPMQNAISRHFERQSDRYAIEQTKSPDAYRSAFKKLAVQNKAELDPPALEVMLFHSHPPIAERLKIADDFAG